MEVSTKNAAQIYKTTERGTPIVKPGEDMNKNTFLKILSAEMSNQDPTKPQDTTAYITQLSQFASLEQMSTLNSTMRLTGAQNLNGKFVALDVFNGQGVQESGVVKSVFKRGNEVFITVDNGSGKLVEYGYDQVSDILNIEDGSKDNINFINTSALIGKTVDIQDANGKVQGVVKEVYRDVNGIMVKLDVNGKINDYPYGYITNIR
ncbi:flagellar hook assembly protein FlgD [Clostridium sp. UBA4548]|uniref:flagellar hook assembly protein FlgD n=1 Tax=Clostridium sp. UBA4548 TaxID=1946361 RepID=UPI0025BF7DFB|nr:flagellar hook capping FlgD N-terminal domain-containing protein [Clostridium sp. UBA4548]